MSVSDDFRLFVLEQLGRVVDVTAKKMFGALGLYSDGVFFAIVDDDVLYYKVGDANRARFERAGSRAFQPYDDGRYSTSYYELPPEVLEDQDQLRVWTAEAISVARLARGSKRQKKPQ